MAEKKHIMVLKEEPSRYLAFLLDLEVSCGHTMWLFPKALQMLINFHGVTSPTPPSISHNT